MVPLAKFSISKTPKGPFHKIILDALITSAKLLLDCGPDYEGNFYPTVIINGREWMAENLRLRNAPAVNGPDLVYSNDFDNWTSSGNAFNGIRAYCYPDDNINNYEDYGVLYTWHAVRWVDLCPQGWHIPSIDEWWDMFESLDPNQYAYSTASDELRSIEGWITPGNNLSGMNIKSAGSTLGVVPLRPTLLGFRASFWTSTEMDSEHAEYIDIFIPNESYGIGVIKSFQTSGTRRKKWNAASCRCIKDE
jgi:uncharacterized protein (TIGR02145 family)